MSRNSRWGRIKAVEFTGGESLCDVFRLCEISTLDDMRNIDTVLLKFRSKVVAWLEFEEGPIPGGGCSGDWETDEHGNHWYCADMIVSLRLRRMRRPRVWSRFGSESDRDGDIVYETELTHATRELVFHKQHEPE